MGKYLRKLGVLLTISAHKSKMTRFLQWNLFTRKPANIERLSIIQMNCVFIFGSKVAMGSCVSLERFHCLRQIEHAAKLYMDKKNIWHA